MKGLKSKLILPFARKVVSDLRQWSVKAVDHQMILLKHLLRSAENTEFGREYRFREIRDYDQYQKQVPLCEYEDLLPYIEKIKKGKRDILWPGLPQYFAKTSGTTSGVKYIPMSRQSTPFHVNTARNSLFNYMVETGRGDFFNGKMLYLSGSPALEKTGGILTGRLSGIVNHQIPAWIRGNKLPTYSVNCIEDWEEKVKAMVKQTANTDLRLIGGIPPWVQMYYEVLLEYTGKKTVKEVFPNLSLFVYGGVHYEPYRSKLETLVGAPLDSLETFPASEGFFAFQDKFPSQGLLLNTRGGIFYEFVPVSDLQSGNPRKLHLGEVETGVSYLLVVSTNAGLWSYNMGDTVEFVDLSPPRLVVTGRVKHFISAFGEHVIGKEVEEAILAASREMNFQIVEFSVAPQVNPIEGLPYHEWFMELSDFDGDVIRLESILDKAMQNQNIYYRDLIEGRILRPAKVTLLRSGAFRSYMESIGKLGGQNKVPRLANDRTIAQALEKFQIGPR